MSVSALRRSPVVSQPSRRKWQSGCFAAIYQPAGIAVAVQGRVKTSMPLAVNGIFGNLGVAAAPPLTGAILNLYDWKWAFIIPGVFSIATGIAYSFFLKASDKESLYPTKAQPFPSIAVSLSEHSPLSSSPPHWVDIFQSTTYALPKFFELRLQDMAASLSLVSV
ncbi:MAG: MFS transporter [Pseudomonadota bacterium]|nr:MFS transporter [Pseudomonadota bacterium]